MTQRGGTIALVAAAATCLGGALAAPAPAATAPAISLSAASTPVLPCGGPNVTTSLTDSANFHGLFANYGNNQPSGSFDGWTAGDTDYSVTLPDGRRVWDFTDPLLGTVALNSNNTYQIVDGGTSHNVAVLEQPNNGPLYATLHSSQTFSGSNWFLGWIPEPSSAASTSQHTPFFNPLAMTVERDASTGSNVLRAVGIYGDYSANDESFVATFNLGSHPTLQGIAYIPAPQAVANTNLGILWGDALIQQGGFTYIYGRDNQTTNAGQFFYLSSAYLARMPTGKLNQPSQWTYFNGNFSSPGWVSDPQQARPINPRGGTYPCETGVVPLGAGYSAAKLGSTYYMFTRDPNATGSITAYSSATPWGPWAGPTEDDPSNSQFGFYTPPIPSQCPGSFPGCTYGPHIHADVAADANGWLLSYDVNTTDSDRGTNIENYRPKFIRIKIS